MSTDGTKPPSIAPRGGTTDTAGARPATSPGPSTGSDRPRPASGPVSGTTAPSVAKSAAAEDQPSVTDRLKRAAQSAAETARNALPTKSDDSTDVELDEPASARPGDRPATARPADRPATSRPAGRSATSTTTTGTTPAVSSGPRKVRLAVARVDPWSIMKLAFLLSVAVGIMIVVAAAVVWYTLDGLHVFTSVNSTIAEITGDPNFFNLLEFVEFERIISLATMIAVVDVVLLTALATIGAFLYNIVAALVGGVHLTLTDD